jgi:hypothetical protein
MINGPWGKPKGKGVAKMCSTGINFTRKHLRTDINSKELLGHISRLVRDATPMKDRIHNTADEEQLSNR